MKKLLMTAGFIALFSTGAHAQLLGGGGAVGGSLGGTINGTIGSPLDTTTLDRTTQSLRSTVDGTVETEGNQDIDARNGRVSARRSASGSVNGSTASLADLPIPSMTGGQASAHGRGEAQGSADAQLIGTDALVGTLAPAAGQTRTAATRTVARGSGAANGLIGSVPQPGLPSMGNSASGEGSANGNASAALLSSPLVVAGSAASQAAGTATIAPGMPVMTPDGASLGKVRQVIADGRGNVQQVVVKQGKATRTLPAGMFSAQGDALVAGEASGQAARRSANEGQPAQAD